MKDLKDKEFSDKQKFYYATIDDNGKVISIDVFSEPQNDSRKVYMRVCDFSDFKDINDNDSPIE